MSEAERKELRFLGTASLMVTANRIEWNKAGGILLKGTNSMQITGCSIDRYFGPDIQMVNSTANTVSGCLA